MARTLFVSHLPQAISKSCLSSCASFDQQELPFSVRLMMPLDAEAIGCMRAVFVFDIQFSWHTFFLFASDIYATSSVSAWVAAEQSLTGYRIALLEIPPFD